MLRKQDDDDDTFIYYHQDAMNRTEIAFTPFDIYPTEIKKVNLEEESDDFFESIEQQHQDNSNTDVPVIHKKKNNPIMVMSIRKEQSFDGNTEYVINRQMVVDYLRKLSADVYLDDDDGIIKSHSITIHLIRFDQLKINKKLFSSTILVNVQPRVYKLPVQCKSNVTNSDVKATSWIMDRFHRLESLVLNLTNRTITTSNGKHVPSYIN